MNCRTCFFSFLWAISLMGCDSLRRQVSPKDLTSEPEKLVVSCFISPQDTVLAALVSRSRPLLGFSSMAGPDVSDATVTLSDGTHRVTMRGVPTQGINGSINTVYQTPANQLLIVAGQTYTLRVSVPDGRVVTAICRVPSAVALYGVEVDSSTYVRDGQPVNDYYARLRWRDPGDQVNYYRIAGNNQYKYVAVPPGGDSSLYRMGRGNWYFNASALLDDRSTNGKEMVSSRAYLLTPSTWINGQGVFSRPNGQLNAYLLSTDENYYRFHQSLAQQEQSDGNPFAEPVLIPSNIQDGLGCFGAYNRTRWTLTVR